MTTLRMRIFACAIVTTLTFQLASLVAAAPLGTQFTYQGEIKFSGQPINGTADFQFTLWPSATAGAQLGAIQSVNNVALVDGLFTAQIDFGNNVFDGSERWLQVAVRSPAGSGIFTTLLPRQELTPVPYALQTRGLFVNAGGSLGVGTTAPLSRLTVNGDITFVEDNDTIRFPAVVGSAEPMIDMFASGTTNADRMVIAHSPLFPTWGLQYQDAFDRFRFIGAGTPALTIELSSGDAEVSGDLSVAGDVEVTSDVHVAGDVVIGPSALDATAGEERLRIIRGTINANGTVAAGAGFSCVHNGGGDYTISFNTPFAGTPSVVVTPRDTDAVALQAQVYSVGTTWVTVLTKREASDVPVPSNVPFCFIAVGPR